LKGLSPVECAVQQALYWPDGRRKKQLRSQPFDKRRDSNLQMAEALLDKYNNDHKLSWVSLVPPSPLVYLPYSFL
jgi:hypothetical protein